MKTKTKFFLILIFIAGLFLRVWKLTQIPSGLTPDEAAQGYTAYSILKTGKDEWGKTFPFNLRSFGDFKPPLQTYLMIPSVAVFGLNEFAVRFPNALLSSLAIVGIFLLAGIFFGDWKIGALSALLLAFSPWHLPLSRGAFEANLAVFFISFGVYFFLKEKQFLSALFLGLGMFSYHSTKLFAPIIVILFLVFKAGKNFSRYSRFIIPYSIFFLISFLSFFTGGQTRGADVAVFNPTDNWSQVADERWYGTKAGLPDFISRVFHNKLSYSFSQFGKNYVSYLSPQFLFSEGPGEGTYGMIPGRGVLWWWELSVLLFGIYQFIKKPDRKILLLLIILLLAPLPAALTKGDRSASRVATMMPWIQIFSAWSLFLLAARFKKFIPMFIILCSIFFLFFLEDYFVQSPRKISKEMLYGRCQAIREINFGKAERVIVSRKLSEPQAYVMFCLSYPPETAQKETNDWLRYQQAGLKFVDQLGEYYLGKFVFKEINWASDSKLENTVLIGLPSEFPEKTGKIINYPDGGKAIVIYEN